ncbi:MAG: hypothetical protein HW380_1416 [Magnetococcales bacterium]|nr:hypothetical protein [Magnetococcales bacterium]HIJ85420.1 GGDEF domain-containing protein [Magnetococcales bacterium]
MVPEEIVPYLVEMTGQSDRVGLIAHLVKTLNKFTSASQVRFFDIHQKAIKGGQEGKLQVESVLVEPLCPNEEVITMDSLPGLGKLIRQTSHLFMPFMHIKSGENEQLLFAMVEGSKVHSILHLDSIHFTTPDEMLAKLFWDMYINLERTIRAKDQDPLTGLLNRRSFDETITNILDVNAQIHEINRAGGTGACLAVFDIDHFKRVNDTFGHAIGDEVLILFAQQMQRIFRVADILYRFGGEEFLVILLKVDAPMALAALERFRETIANYRFPQVETVTVSIGFVMVNGQDFPPELIEKADKALYYSKENGRNQVNNFDDLVQNGRIANIERSTHDEVEMWD